jgi:hypothetical protein
LQKNGGTERKVTSLLGPNAIFAAIFAFGPSAVPYIAFGPKSVYVAFGPKSEVFGALGPKTKASAFGPTPPVRLVPKQK